MINLTKYVGYHFHHVTVKFYELKTFSADLLLEEILANSDAAFASSRRLRGWIALFSALSFKLATVVLISVQ